MTPPDDLSRLPHLVDAAAKAVAFCRRRSREDLDGDEMLVLALTELIEIVGEAAKQVSDPLKTALPEMPWIAAARMRDRLVHHYFDIDLDVLWSTVEEDRPTVLAQALRGIAELESRG